MPVNDNITELGTKPIGGLLLKYATPAVIAMTASSLYNIIDAIFIGQGVGALAIAGVSLSFPVMQLTAAFGSMVGVGASTLLSVKLGEKDYDVARRILGNVITLNVIMGIAIGILMLIFINPILFFFGASEATVSYARDFMTIILAGNVATHLYFGLNAMLRASSHPREAMMATIFTVLINVILAPLFIYVFHWGIRGAALATVMSQTLVLLWQIHIFRNPNEFIHFEKGTYRLRKRIVVSSLAIGLSPFLMNLCGCFVVIFFNWSLAHYGNDLEIAAYGIANRLAFFFAMIVVGMNQGMQPIAGFNYGARRYDRLNKVLVKTIAAATVVVTAGFLLGEIFPYACARAFTKDPELIQRSIFAIRIYFVTFPIIGFQMVATNFFQCIGHVKKSIFLSLTRQLIFLLPFIWLLPRWWGLNGVWYAVPVSDILSSVLTGAFLLHALHQFHLTRKESSF
ncbi:MAG: MATE family efflux transporter [Bacteroidaceae bacterium]|nr:MATE family efflux transporter [Bacteroidaceae bacterium]